MFILRLLLIGIIVYLPNAQLFNVEFTVKGLNIINAMFLLALLTMLAMGLKAKTPPPLKGVFGFFFAMLLYAFLVGVLQDASQIAEDLTVLKNSVFYMLLFFLFYHAARDLRTVRLLFVTLLVVTMLSALQGLEQALAYGLTTFNEARRVSAPFGWEPANANRAAIYFSIFLPLFAAAALFWKSRPKLRLLAAGCFAFGTFIVFYTYSRQAYAILAFLALMLALRRSKWIVLAMVVVVLNYQVWAPETVVARMESTVQKDEWEAARSGERFDESTASRFLLWSGAAEMMLDRPWGSGLNHFKREIGAYVPSYSNMDAHNYYVLIAAEAGPLGLLATGALILGLLRLARRVREADTSDVSRVIGEGYQMAVVAVILGSLYGSRFLDHDVMGNFWVLTALVARYLTLKQEGAALPAAQPARSARAALRRPMPAA